MDEARSSRAQRALRGRVLTHALDAERLRSRSILSRTLLATTRHPANASADAEGMAFRSGEWPDWLEQALRDVTVGAPRRSCRRAPRPLAQPPGTTATASAGAEPLVPRRREPDGNRV